MLGPLHGVRIVEFAALGPAPMAAMILADLGAEVVRIDRARDDAAKPASDFFDPALDVLGRSRRIVALDLKQAEDRAQALALVARADAVIEGLRPGAMERLGLGPEVCLGVNPRLVYGRMTGWGQTGPLASAAGHDINYLSLSGALYAIGEAGGRPVPPLNLVADGGGGAMLLAVGILAALVEARGSGRGQIVDAAMTDGAALMTSMIHTLRAMGQWSDRRGDNLLDGGAPYYGCYRCADGGWIAVGAIEERFYALLLDKAGLTDPAFLDRADRTRWPLLRERLEAVFATRTRAEWCTLLEGSDACVSPVLSLSEAPDHPHNRARGTFVELGGVTQPAPAPRFDRTPCPPPRPPTPPETAAAILADWTAATPA